MAESGRRIAEALAARPDDEPPWGALRRSFDVLTRMNEAAPEQALGYLRMLRQTPSLRAGHHEEQLSRHELLVPEIARRLGADPDRPEDTRPSALAAAALACLDGAATAWVACEGTVPLAVLLGAMGALAG